MKKRMQEYLRRNLLHAASVGVVAGARASLSRARETHQPKWLIRSLENILDRALRVAHEMACHRDEVSPYKGQGDHR